MSTNKLIKAVNWSFMITLLCLTLISWKPSEYTIAEPCILEIATDLYQSNPDSSIFKINASTCELEEATVNVYDKYGDLVYSNDQMDFEWDIKTLEHLLDGTSFKYVITFKSTAEEIMLSQEGYFFVWN